MEDAEDDNSSELYKTPVYFDKESDRMGDKDTGYVKTEDQSPFINL
jgi:hypothetical protein